MPKKTTPKTDEITEAMPLETTELASVIEPSSELELDYKPLAITSNVEGIKAHIKSVIEPILSGEIDVSTDDLEKYARGTLADLNKLLDGIDRKRIDTERDLMQPWTAVSNELKEAVKEGRDAYRKAKNALDAKAEELRKQKHDELQADYEGSVGEKIAKAIPFDKMANPSWFTKNYGEKKAYEELCARAEGIIKDMKRLDNQPLNNRAEVLAFYCETLDLGAALDKDAEITAARNEANRKAKEAEEAFKLSQETKEEPKPAVAPEPKPAAKDVEHDLSDYTLILRDISVFDAQAIAQFAQQTIGRKPELKNKKWMEGKAI